jgi:hypothetical protein
LLTTQYALMSQWTIVEGIRRDHLAKWRDDPERFNKLAIYYASGVAVKVPFDDITFITTTSDADLLQQVHIAEQKYLACIETLRLRNERLEEFYRDPSVIRESFDFETGRGRVRADPAKVFLIRQITNALYGLVDSTLPKIVGEIEELEKFIRRHFPGRTALKMIGKDEKSLPLWKRRLRALLRPITWLRIALFFGACVAIVIIFRCVDRIILTGAQRELIAAACIALLLIGWRALDRLIRD